MSRSSINRPECCPTVRDLEAPKLKPRLVAARFVGTSALIIVLIVLLLDKAVIPMLEDQGLLTSRGWRMDNNCIWQQMMMRNFATPACPVWSSALFPANPERRKAKRILIMGDSFVWGDGCSNMNMLWWRQLEKLLEDNCYNDCEVIAAGMCGYQTNEQLAWLKRDIKRFKPDLVIWGYVTNDAQERDEHGVRYVDVYNFPETGLIKIIKDWAIENLPNLSDTLFSLRNSNRRRVGSGERNYYEYGEFELKVLQGLNFERYKRRVKELGNFMREANVPTFVMTLPNGFSYPSVKGYNPAEDKDFFKAMKRYYSERYAPVRPLYQRENIRWVDTLDDFVLSASKDPYISTSSSPLRIGINPCNGHPGPFATRFFAEKALAVLTEHYPQYLGPKTTLTRHPPKFNDCLPVSMNLTRVGDFTYELVYPFERSEVLLMPVRKSHIQLNLERPSEISGVMVDGPDLKECTLYGTFEDSSTGYDPQIPEKLSSVKGASCHAQISHGRRLSTLKIAARFSGPNRKIKVEITPAQN